MGRGRPKLHLATLVNGINIPSALQLPSDGGRRALAYHKNPTPVGRRGLNRLPVHAVWVSHFGRADK